MEVGLCTDPRATTAAELDKETQDLFTYFRRFFSEEGLRFLREPLSGPEDQDKVAGVHADEVRALLLAGAAHVICDGVHPECAFLLQVSTPSPHRNLLTNL